MKKDDPTGLRGVNGFSDDAYRRAAQEELSSGSARPRGAIRIAVVAIVLSVLFTYGFLYAILPPVASHQVKAK
ncbi:hypothetical protein BCF11_2525 [Collimonas sp. PA-H2]|uniref:hypothetical protein n=1 Tax=Collimonas sp. PA-H2 TaxID=1881062 RepID=UPI000BF96D3B|nr:hypothetical protein [Collimonas sp. PA-H2]PFH10115.1 hypothetical protein BCF11_2525 [Collimonas sp. PA-H2]